MISSLSEADRDLDNVQYESYRKIIDVKFNALHDDLQDAYYTYWKKGASHPWQVHDVQATPAESKELFDKLHGLIWQEHILAMKAKHDVAATKEKGFQENMVDKPLDKEGNPQGVGRYDKAVASKAVSTLDGITITIP